MKSQDFTREIFSNLLILKNITKKLQNAFTTICVTRGSALQLVARMIRLGSPAWARDGKAGRDLAEYSFAECRGRIELGEGFSRQNVIVFDGALEKLPKIRLSRQGAAVKEISGCRLEFGAGARGQYTIYVGPNPLQLVVGADTNCVVDLRAWRKPVVDIGARTTINGCRLIADDATVVLGEDCMLSDDITLQGGDQHGLIDLGTMEVLNRERDRIELGEHVWLGRKSLVMPRVSIGAGSVVGAGAIVTSSAGPCRFLVGVPARVVRENASWTRSPEGPSEAERRFFDRMRPQLQARA